MTSDLPSRESIAKDIGSTEQKDQWTYDEVRPIVVAYVEGRLVDRETTIGSLQIGDEGEFRFDFGDNLPAEPGTYVIVDAAIGDTG